MIRRLTRRRIERETCEHLCVRKAGRLLRTSSDEVGTMSPCLIHGRGVSSHIGLSSMRKKWLKVCDKWREIQYLNGNILGTWLRKVRRIAEFCFLSVQHVEWMQGLVLWKIMTKVDESKWKHTTTQILRRTTFDCVVGDAIFYTWWSSILIAGAKKEGSKNPKFSVTGRLRTTHYVRDQAGQRGLKTKSGMNSRFAYKATLFPAALLQE